MTSSLLEPTTRPRPTAPRALAVLLLLGVVVGTGLRLGSLDTHTFSPDESYTAFAIDRPTLDVVRYLADTDPHPPLYYVTVAPVQRITDAEWALRLPSVVCSIGALLVLAWWQRGRGKEGVLAVALFAVMPFQLIFAAQARMYGLMVLVGVVAAWASERWLDDRGRRWIVVACITGLVAAFSQASGVLLVGGLALVPGLRRDRSAWEWRCGALGVAGLFGAVWGATALSAAGGSLYGRPSFEKVTVTINEVLAPVPANRWLVLPMVVLGACALVQRAPAMGRVWLALVAAPVAAALIVSFRSPIFIPKTLAIVSWGIPVAIAALVPAAARLRPIAGAAVGALALLVVLPYVGEAMHTTENTDGIVEATRRSVQPGDAVAAHPPGTLIPWYLDEAAPSSRPIDVPFESTAAWVPGDQPFSGRVWLVDTLYAAPALDVDAPSCGTDDVIDGVYRLRCVLIGAQGGQ